MEQKARMHFPALRETRGFFEASEIVEPSEWDRYIASLELNLRFPAFSAIGFAKLVRSAEKESFERVWRTQGLTAYTLAESASGTNYPVILISPDQIYPVKDKPLDLALLPGVQDAMSASLKTNRPEATGALSLSLRGQSASTTGILLVLPVYDRSRITGSDRLDGFMVGIMELERLFMVLLENAQRNHLYFTFSESGSNQPLYTSRDALAEAQAKFSEDREFAFAGHKWTMRVETQPDFFQTSENFLPQLSLIGGLLISAALFGITWSQVRARAMAETLSNNLATGDERFRLVNKATNDIIYDWDTIANHITWNEAMSLSFAYGPDKIIPSVEWWEDKIHPLDRVRVVRGLESALKKGGEFWADEYRFRRGDNEYATVIDRGYILRNEKGDVIRMIGSMMDITDRKKSEAARHRSDQKLKLHFEQTPLAVIEWDLGFHAIDWNPGAEKTFGYSAQEAIGRHASELIVPESARRHVNEVWQALLVANSFGQRSTNQNCTKDGRMIVCDWYNTPVTDREGKVISVITLAMDVTEQRHVADALEEEKELLSVTMRSIGEGVVATDTAENIVLLNRVGEHMLGCHQRDVLGQPLSRWLKLQHIKSGEMLESPVTKVIRANGQVEFHSQQALLVDVPNERRISFSCSPIYGGDSRLLGSVLVFRDVTDETRTAEELLRTSKLESLGILAGGIAHDFNNILTVIIGNISIAKMQTPQGNPAQNRLDEAEKASLRARDLTLQLLTFAKGGAPIKQTASITDIIKDTTGFVLHGSKVQCVYDLAPDLWAVEVDEGQISQVMDNLVINAVQAMPNGGKIFVSGQNVTLDANSGIHLPAGKYVQVSVQDEGTGIPMDILPKIFDPYFTTKASGNGLGLATSHSIIRNHNGLMTVQSIVGEGTTFKLYLPASDKPLRQTRIDLKPLTKCQGRVLVMDDDDRIRDLLKSMIEALGYEAETTATGNEAVNRYRDAMSAGKRFDVSIMDLTIPGGMGGKEAVKLIKELDPKAKAIVSSGYSNDPVMANHQENGFIGVLSKPYKIQDLARVLEDTIGHQDKQN
ncbi:MAG TPA: PAS domain S-box protein [Verrucomicrobiae bacterium]